MCIRESEESKVLNHENGALEKYLLMFSILPYNSGLCIENKHSLAELLSPDISSTARIFSHHRKMSFCINSFCCKTIDKIAQTSVKIYVHCWSIPNYKASGLEGKVNKISPIPRSYTHLFLRYKVLSAFSPQFQSVIFL